MTREELRAKAIEVMAKAFANRRSYDWDTMAAWLQKVTLDELDDVLEALGAEGFKVLGPTTDEMHKAAKQLRGKDKAGGRPTAWGDIFNVMATAGDLTRKP